jgi:sec-independent protein translocase protein TatA
MGASQLAYHPTASHPENAMGIGFKELLIILAIALLIFGAKRLKTIGSDLGGAVKGFKKAMDEGDDKETHQLNAPESGQKDADFNSTPAGKSGSKSSNA